jgi:hypothetical protein
MLIINWRFDENKTLDDVGCHDGRLDKPTTAGCNSVSQGRE